MPNPNIPKYPGAIATDTDLLVANDNATTTLTNNVLVGDTTLNVASTALFNIPCVVFIDFEQILCTARTGSTFTGLVRGFNGTSPAGHASSAVVNAFIPAYSPNQASVEIQAIENALGIALANVKPLTTKGDLYGFDTGITRVPIGSDGQILTADSAQAKGLKWASGNPLTTKGDLFGFDTANNRIPVGTLGQVLTVDPLKALGVKWASLGITRSGDYNFAAQAPGGSLTGGVGASITLTPVPFGVNGADTNHYLYISAGTGTAEAVLITGGTAVAGAASGTITFTPANSHSGAWTIQSASSGIQEALIGSASPSKIQITVPATFHQTVTIPNGLYAIYGFGGDVTAVTRAADFVNGDLFYNPSNSASYNFIDMRIDNTAAGAVSGAAIHVRSGSGVCDSVVILNGYIGYWLEGAATNLLINCAYVTSNTASKYGIFINSFGGVPTTDTKVLGGNLYGPVAVNTVVLFRIESGDGVGITGMTFSGGNIQLNCTANLAYISNVYCVNCFFDTAYTTGIGIYSAVSALAVSNIRILGCQINGEQGANTNYGVDIAQSNGLFAGATITNVQIIGCNIQAWGLFGIAMGAGGTVGGGIDIIGNIITNNNTRNVASDGGIFCNGSTVVKIIGNNIGGANHYSNIVFSNTNTNYIIGLNDLSTFVTSPISGTTPGNLVLGHNRGIDNILPAVASASSIALPVNPIFTITGTTGVGTVTAQYAGQKGKFITTSGVVVFTAGASIGNTFSTVQNVPVDWFSDGTKIYLH